MCLALVALAGCGDPPPDVAVFATGATGLKLSVQRCKFLDPTSCGNPPAVILDGDHDKGQAGVYDLTSGDKFVLQFIADTAVPAPARCRKTVVTFHQAQQVINVALSTSGIDVTCDSSANCDPAVPCI